MVKVCWGYSVAFVRLKIHQSLISVNRERTRITETVVAPMKHLTGLSLLKRDFYEYSFQWFPFISAGISVPGRQRTLKLWSAAPCQHKSWDVFI